MPAIICKNCGKEVIAHSKQLCTTCYKRLLWKPKLRICERCKREKFHHAKGLCSGCYQSVFKLESNKAWNYKKYHNLDLEEYRKLTKKCVICGFDKVVDLHHLDENKNNNYEKNLIGLCPNHHRMIHNLEFRKEMRNILLEKGYVLPEDPKLDFSLN